MLKGFEILKTIPAYDFSDARQNTKEEQEKYIKRSSIEDKKAVRKAIKHMLNNYDNGEMERFALNVILDNPHLLQKTKICYDGSYRNIRICKFDDYNHYDYDRYYITDRHYTSLDIDWKNVIGKEIGWNIWSDFYNSITKDDIIEVLNNIEEIFIQ
jgi:hypothetical protein